MSHRKAPRRRHVLWTAAALLPLLGLAALETPPPTEPGEREVTVCVALNTQGGRDACLDACTAGMADRVLLIDPVESVPVGEGTCPSFVEHFYGQEV